MTASDEAFSEFWKAWHSMDPADLREAGAPTSKEIWSHAWQEAVKQEREAAASEAESWRGGKLLLNAGEMTAQEMRTVRAVTGGIAAAIRARSREGVKSI